MRVGKTAPLVIAAQILRNQRVLVICPVIALAVWEKNIRDWVVDPDRQKGFKVVSFDYARINKDELLGPWDTLIIDESHALKNPSSGRTKAILGKNGIASHAHNIWFSTGTPMPNHAAELWPMLYVFGLTKLSYDNFVKRFCNYYVIRGERQITGSKKTRLFEINKLLKKCMLRYTRAEVYPELPPQYYQSVTIPKEELGTIDADKEVKEKCRAEYEILKAVLAKTYSSAKAAQLALEAVSQSSTTLRRIIGLRKVKPVAAMIKQELKDKEYAKIIIFGVHTDVLKNLKEELKEFNPMIIIGSTDSRGRKLAVNKFGQHKKNTVFIGNVKAAGMSIDLSIADQVLFIEKSWVPGDNDQAADRCAGPNQTNPVCVRSVMTNYLLDTRVGEVLKNKIEDIQNVLN